MNHTKNYKSKQNNMTVRLTCFLIDSHINFSIDYLTVIIFYEKISF
jgi:hypothetical protein